MRVLQFLLVRDIKQEFFFEIYKKFIGFTTILQAFSWKGLICVSFSLVCIMAIEYFNRVAWSATQSKCMIFPTLYSYDMCSGTCIKTYSCLWALSPHSVKPIWYLSLEITRRFESFEIDCKYVILRFVIQNIWRKKLNLNRVTQNAKIFKLPKDWNLVNTKSPIFLQNFVCQIKFHLFFISFMLQVKNIHNLELSPKKGFLQLADHRHRPIALF